MTSSRKKPQNKSKEIELSREAPVERRINAKDLAVMKIMTEHQIRILTTPTPKYAIKYREGPRHTLLKYIPHGYANDQLNKAFGFDWDYKLLPYFNGKVFHLETVTLGIDRKTSEPIVKRTIATYGELVIRIHNPNKPSEVIATVTKPGPGSSVWYPENELGDAIKSAASDGLKVAASKLGIGLDLYWDDDAEYQKFEEKNNQVDEVIDAISENNKPETITELITQSNQKWGAKLPDLKSILGDSFMKEFKPEMWDKLEEHYAGEKDTN